MAEQWVFNPLVQGSTPWRPTRRSSRFSGAYFHVWVCHSGTQSGVAVAAVLSCAVVSSWWLSVLHGRVPGMLALPGGFAVLVTGAVAWCGLARWSGWSGGEAGEGPAAPFAGFLGEPGGGAALGLFLAGGA